MHYTVKSPILGFEDMNTIKFEKIDDMFATVRDVNNEDISFSLVNPYSLREYSFDISASVKILLDIDENSRLSVFNIVVIQSPLDNSCVNFLAPLIFNEDNKTVAQLVLNSSLHPDFGMAETIRSLQEAQQ